MPTACLERPVELPDLLRGAATEGTVSTTMTDIDGLGSALESDAELTARF